MGVDNTGMISKVSMDSMAIEHLPGAILKKWKLIRDMVGNVPKVQKPGMKFATLSSENVIDKVRDACDEEGVLIYPISVTGEGKVVEDGTLADVKVVFRVQAIEDGSYIEIAGFGLGADSQDKAGGKAGTYAMKAALIQALLASGSKKRGGVKAPDTDDEETPIPGGVKPKSNRPTLDSVRDNLALVETKDDYTQVVKLAKQLTPEEQAEIRPELIDVKAKKGL